MTTTVTAKLSRKATTTAAAYKTINQQQW